MRITERACPGQFPGKDDHTFIDCQNWYAIQTLSGCEKKLVSTLQGLFKKIKLYLPTRKVIHQLKGVQHIMELPLFPGYIFVYRSISESLDALDKADARIAFKPVEVIKHQTPLYMNIDLATQVSFPLVHILTKTLPSIRPWKVEQTIKKDAPFQVLSMTIGEIPVIVRAHNQGGHTSIGQLFSSYAQYHHRGRGRASFFG